MSRRRVLLTQNNGGGDMVIMTSNTNPKILQILYNAGLCASPDVMYKSEAEAITNSDLGAPNVYNGSASPFYNSKTNESFDAFQYFTGITATYSYCFRQANLTHIIFPQTLTSIGGMWGLGGNNFTETVIPASVTYMGFYCYLSGDVIFERVIPTNIGDWTTFNGSNTINIYVPDASVDAYKTAWQSKAIPSNWNITAEAMLAKIKPMSEYNANN